MSFWQLKSLPQASVGLRWSCWLKKRDLPGQLWSKVTIILQWLQELLLTQVRYVGLAVRILWHENKALPTLGYTGGYKALLKEIEKCSGGHCCHAPCKMTWLKFIIRDSFQPLLFVCYSSQLALEQNFAIHRHIFFFVVEARLGGEGKWEIGFSDPDWIPRAQCVTALILCLVDTRMIAWLWTVSLLLCTSRTYRDAHSFVCSFVHLFIQTLV